MGIEHNFYRSAILSDTISSPKDENSSFKDKYSLGEQLGWGQFGIIRSCSDRHSNDIFACKSIAKNRLTTNEDIRGVKLEIEIMSKLSGHPNVVDLKAVYEDEDYVHLVMELCEGGELFHQLERFGRYPENEARVLFRHLMEVVMYCHEMGIVHRDLKPENILLATKSLSSPIKLADFGLATYIRPGQSLHGTVGSPFYIAPEVLAGGYNQSADVWSAGVILYILLSGMPPFWGKTKSKIFDAVRAANLQFPPDLWDHLSPSAKDLITRMLCMDPSKRLTAKEVLDHCWMKDQSHEPQFPNTHNIVNSKQLDTFSTPISRAQDYSFSDKSPSTTDIKGVPLTTLTCRSSFSSFLIQSGSQCFSFSSCRDNSFTEFSSPIPSMPSFSFVSPFSEVKVGNFSLGGGTKMVEVESSVQDSSLENQLFPSDTSPIAKFQKLEGEQGTEHRRVRARANTTSSSKGSAISNKRNHTIELGGLNQIDLNVVTESVIRWASCEHISTTSSFLRSSLVF